MTLKLYEALGNEKGCSFTITIGDVTKTLTLDKFSIDTLAVCEEQLGVSVDELESVIQSKITTVGMAITWELLREKDEFNNDLKTFRRCMNIANLNTVAKALTDAFYEGMPIAKNDQGPVTV